MRAVKEPKRHTKLYRQLVAQLVNGDHELSKAIAAIVDVMAEHHLKPEDVRRIGSYLAERGRWQQYNVQQSGTTEYKGKVEVEGFDDEDDEFPDFRGE